MAGIPGSNQVRLITEPDAVLSWDEPNRLKRSKKQLYIRLFLVYENLPALGPVIDKTQVTLDWHVDFPPEFDTEIGH